MEIDFDPAKNRLNRAKHGVDLADASRFDLDTALIWSDDREDYGEVREVAIGFLDARLYVLVFTRRGNTIRAISLRKATQSEARRYAQNIR